VERLEWEGFIIEAHKVKKECKKILLWFESGQGLLTKNLDENPFEVANKNTINLSLKVILLEILNG